MLSLAPSYLRYVRPLALCLSASLCACSASPPKIEALLGKSAPSEWQAPFPEAENSQTLAQWWASWNDPALLQLQSQAQQHSPTLAQAAARILQARAEASAAGAALWPQLDLNATQGSSRNPLLAPGQKQTLHSTGLDARWEIDLFGANQANRAAFLARLDAREGEWHDARISLAAEVANAYVALRSCEAQADALQEVTSSQQTTVELQQQKNAVGFIAPLELAQQRATLALAVAQAQQQQNECQVWRKTLVVLCDQPEISLRDQLAQGHAQLPQAGNFTLDAIPLKVLLKRPDLRAAMQMLMASAAEIDAARARRYPSIALLGSINMLGIRSAGASQQGNSWSFGPSLNLPLFDAGQRKAEFDLAQARHAEALALFRQKTLVAAKEVEEAMLRLDLANRQLVLHRDIRASDNMGMQAAETSWQVGSSNLLDTQQARRQQLFGQQRQVQLQRERASAWIALYKAVGGDWQRAADDGTEKLSGAGL